MMNNRDSLQKITASKLRFVLLGAAIVLVLACAGLIILGQQAVTSYGTQVATTVAASSSDEKTLHDLENVSRALDSQKPIVEKSKQLIADKSNTYTYQQQIIQDITRYASTAKIQVIGFTFADTASTTGSSTPASPVAATGTTAAAGASVPAGVTPVSVTVSLDGDVPYDSLYKFLQLLEGNLLRMEVDSLDLARPTGDESSSISSLTIRIYKQK